MTLEPGAAAGGLEGGAPPPQLPQDAPPGTVAARLAILQRAGGLTVPLVTMVIAFLIGGAVVAATGHNPFTAYWDILKGAGLNWFAHFDTDTARADAYNFSQTLLQTTTLILTGLAVAFAFRCGMFNIGGQGQYFTGIVLANWVGSRFASMPALPHILLTIVAGTLGGAAIASVAGFLKATRGTHEVISTIMLNWIVFYSASYLFGDMGALQGAENAAGGIPISGDIAQSAKLPVFWGIQALQGLHIGFFVALAMLVVYWLVLNRTTLGYEVRAVGYNPDAAAYGGIDVAKNMVLAMAISGAFAGLAGAIDMTGYLYRYGVSDIPVSAVGFIGIAVALLGRNTAVGVALAALLFGALNYGTGHGLQSTAIQPGLASNLQWIIQGLIVLFVGADVLILYLWNLRKKARLAARKAEAGAAA